VCQPPSHGADEPAQHHDPPYPSEDAHVSVLVAFVSLGVEGRDPLQLAANQLVFERVEVRKVLDDHDVLDVEVVAPFGPQGKEDDAVEHAGDSEGEIVVFEVYRVSPEQQYAGNRAQENADGNGRVI